MREYEESEETVQSAIDKLFNKPHLKQKYLSAQISGNWEKIVGKYIASKTAGVQLHNSVLTLKLISAPLRQEISYNKEKLIGLINEELKDAVVKDIRIQ